MQTPCDLTRITASWTEPFPAIQSTAGSRRLGEVDSLGLIP